MMTAQYLKDVLNVDELHCAFLVDEQGNEIPITRAMIDQACEGLSYTIKPQFNE